MSINNTFRGDALPVAQITRLTPANVVIGDKFTVTCNGKSVFYVAVAATVHDVVQGLAAAIAGSTIAEFGEFLASGVDTNGDGNFDYLALTAATAGVPFKVTASASSSTFGTVIVTELTPGHAGVNEVHKITLAAAYTGGTFTITYNFGAGNVTTGNIAYNANAAAVQTALTALTGVGAGNVLVTGGPGPSAAWFATWTGALGSQSIAPGTVNGGSLTGTTSVVVNTTQPGAGKSNCIQTYDLHFWNNFGGTYTLALDGQVSTTLGTGSTPAQVKAALEALPNIGSGNVQVYGQEQTSNGLQNDRFYFVEFIGALAGTAVNALVLDTSAMVPPSWTTLTATILQQGGATTSDAFIFVKLGTPGAGASGLWSATYGNRTTGAIELVHSGGSGTPSPSNQLQIALGALPNLSGVGVQVYGAPFTPFEPEWNFLIRLIGLASPPAATLTANVGGLSGMTGGATVAVLANGLAQQNNQQTITVYATGGTFTLTAGAQTTSALAWNIATGTLQTRIQTDLSTTFTAVTVTGAGTPASPYVVTTTNPGNTAIAQMTANGSLLTGGGGTISEQTAGSAGANEVQQVALEAGVSGGSFTLTFNGATTIAIAWNASAATVQTDLRALVTVNTVSVSGSSGGPWTVTWSGSQANALESLLVGDGSNLTGSFGTQSLVVSTSTFSSGPNHYNDPTNWTLGRVPDSGTAAYFESGQTDCLFGLDQLAICTASASTDTLTFTSLCGLVNDQIVQISSTTTLPGGLSANTNYYIVSRDRNAETCQLATTSGGTPIDLTTAGTGTLTLGVRLSYLEMCSRYTGSIGLSRWNQLGYFEYRALYLHVGLQGTGGGGTQKVVVGSGNGTGSGKIQVNTDVDQVAFRTIETGGSNEAGIPALLWKGTHPSNTLEVLNGDVGVALFPDEAATLASLIERAGSIELGPNVTLTGPIDKTGGALISDGAAINGTCLLH